MLRIKLSGDAAKFIVKLPPKQRRQVKQKLAALRHDPAPPDVGPVKGTSWLRTDIGEYRIVYRVEGDTLLVPIVGKRNDDEVYRRLRRKG